MESLVSIITPNYNASAFIIDCLKSVKNQTYQNWEMIIIDDASTDDSATKIEHIIKDDSRFKLLKLNENSGPAIARNFGIETSKGDYIAFLDSDDSWFPGKLEIQLAFMKKRNIALSFTAYYSVNEVKEKQKMIKVKENVTYKDLLTNNYIGCLTAMYSVDHLGKVYMPIVNKRQDWGLWLKITKKGISAYGIEQPLACYTRRQSSVSSNKFRLLKYNWRIYREHEKLNRIQALYYFMQLFFKKIVK